MGAVESTINGAMEIEGSGLDEYDNFGGRVKRNCLLENTDPLHEHTFDDTRQQQADDEEDADAGWQVGNAYVVTQQPCPLHASPAADATHLGDVKLGVVVVLLKTTGGADRTLWGLLDPPPADKDISAGWALLEGAGEAGDIKLVRKSGHWEVGGAYRARGGAIVRKRAELSSEIVCNLVRGDYMEVLDFEVIYETRRKGKDGDKRLQKPRLRAKVLMWKSREIGWVSPRNSDGVHLLLPMKMQKLEVFTREAICVPVVSKQRQRRGGA